MRTTYASYMNPITHMNHTVYVSLAQDLESCSIMVGTYSLRHDSLSPRTFSYAYPNVWQCCGLENCQRISTSHRMSMFNFA